MTVSRDIAIIQGQRWVYLFEAADLVSSGNGLRLHIRDHIGATLLRAALTHDGATNARVSFATGGVLANLGATISTAWDLQNYKQRRWVYSLERYSLSDAEDVDVLYAGDCLVNATATDESSITPVAPWPSYDLVAVRFDLVQSLSDVQKARARANIGVGEGGGGAAIWGSVTGTLTDQTDLVAALALKATVASPTFTGVPAAPTAAGGTSTTQIATTAFVGGEITTHAGATDPHGDRSFATSAVSTHNAVTTAHGISAFGATLVDDADASTARATLGLGTAATTDATAYATAAQGTDARTPTAHKTSHATGGTDALTAADIGAQPSSATLTTLASATAAGLALMDDADATAQRATLGLGTAAVAATGDFATAAQGTDDRTASGLRETSGPTLLTLGAIADGEYLVRSGTTVVGGTPSGGGGSSNTKWVGAGELIPRVTNGAGIDGEELATNDINLDYLAFDATTSEGAQVSFAWPSGFTTFTATFHWTAASGSGTVTWTAAARCYADDAALDQAFGTAQSVTDTLITANDAHKSSATSAVTPGGTVAAGNLTVVQITRDVADTLAVDARLIGVMLEFAA